MKRSKLLLAMMEMRKSLNPTEKKKSCVKNKTFFSMSQTILPVYGNVRFYLTGRTGFTADDYDLENLSAGFTKKLNKATHIVTPTGKYRGKTRYGNRPVISAATFRDEFRRFRSPAPSLQGIPPEVQTMMEAPKIRVQDQRQESLRQALEYHYEDFDKFAGDWNRFVRIRDAFRREMEARAQVRQTETNELDLNVKRIAEILLRIIQHGVTKDAAIAAKAGDSYFSAFKAWITRWFGDSMDIQNINVTITMEWSMLVRRCETFLMHYKGPIANDTEFIMPENDSNLTLNDMLKRVLGVNTEKTEPHERYPVTYGRIFTLLTFADDVLKNLQKHLQKYESVKEYRSKKAETLYLKFCTLQQRTSSNSKEYYRFRAQVDTPTTRTNVVELLKMVDAFREVFLTVTQAVSDTETKLSSIMRNGIDAIDYEELLEVMKFEFNGTLMDRFRLQRATVCDVLIVLARAADIIQKNITDVSEINIPESVKFIRKQITKDVSASLVLSSLMSATDSSLENDNDLKTMLLIWAEAVIKVLTEIGTLS